VTNKIITITGPSCSGKSTLAGMLTASYDYAEIVSTTTRQIRSGEANGINYHYTTPDEFDTIEMLETVEYNSNKYGSSVKEFEEKFASGKTPIAIVEPNGMAEINGNAIAKGWAVLNVYVGCPTELQAERFLQRLFQDYTLLIRDGSDSDYQKFMKEYIGRMVAMREVESSWEEMFVSTGENIVYIPLFTAESQATDIALINKLITDL
jgi:guanylate kinase